MFSQYHLVVPGKKILSISRGICGSRDRSKPEGIRETLLATPVLYQGATPGMVWAENLIRITWALQQLLSSAATSQAFPWTAG